jgi:hypothetical protein
MAPNLGMSSLALVMGEVSALIMAGASPNQAIPRYVRRGSPVVHSLTPRRVEPFNPLRGGGLAGHYCSIYVPISPAHDSEAIMIIATLDRTRWKMQDAFHHVGRVTHAFFENEVGTKIPRKPKEGAADGDFEDYYERLGTDEVLLALRDGDLIATGRFSSELNPQWPGENEKWIFHAGQAKPIDPSEWRSGRLTCESSGNSYVLTLKEGEYVDITLPAFFVQAIWTLPPPKPVEPTDYTTPYLDLIQRAIAENRIDDCDQSKKEVLVDWFMDQDIEGEPVSGNLAKAMATIIRLPSSQRGGGKRSW